MTFTVIANVNVEQSKCAFNASLCGADPPTTAASFVFSLWRSKSAAFVTQKAEKQQILCVPFPFDPLLSLIIWVNAEFLLEGQMFPLFKHLFFF